MDLQANNLQRKTGIAILMSATLDFQLKKKGSNWNKNGHYIMKKTIHQECTIFTIFHFSVLSELLLSPSSFFSNFSDLFTTAIKNL